MTREERWIRAELKPLECSTRSWYPERLQKHFAHRERMLRNILEIVMRSQELAARNRKQTAFRRRRAPHLPPTKGAR